MLTHAEVVIEDVALVRLTLRSRGPKIEEDSPRSNSEFDRRCVKDR